jgi:hypothetical protein
MHHLPERLPAGPGPRDQGTTRAKRPKMQGARRMETSGPRCRTAIPCKSLGYSLQIRDDMIALGRGCPSDVGKPQRKERAGQPWTWSGESPRAPVPAQNLPAQQEHAEQSITIRPEPMHFPTGARGDGDDPILGVFVAVLGMD